MFSEAVDSVLARIGRGNDPAILADAAAYVNLTVRELAGLRIFTKDTVEDAVVLLNSPSNYQWQRPARFRQMLTALYLPYRERPEFVHPGPALEEIARKNKPYYYAAGNYFMFNTFGLNTSIGLAYALWPRALSYYEPGDRPAVYNRETELWTYLIGENGHYAMQATTPAAEAGLRELVANWVLEDWVDTVVTGAMTKMFLGRRDERAGPTYSLYKSLENTFLEMTSTDTVRRV